MAKTENKLTTAGSTDKLAQKLAGALGIKLENFELPAYQEKYEARCKELALALAAVVLVEERIAERVRQDTAKEQAARNSLPALERTMIPKQQKPSGKKRYAPLDQVEKLTKKSAADVRAALEQLARVGLITAVTEYLGSGEYQTLGYTISQDRRTEAMTFLKRQGVLDGKHIA